MEGSYHGSSPEAFPTAIKMLKRAKGMLREKRDYTLISYIASELREVFFTIFNIKAVGIETRVTNYSFDDEDMTITDDLVLMVKNLGIKQVTDITSTSITCTGILSGDDFYKLKLASKDSSYCKMVKEIGSRAGTTNFSHLTILSNVEYWCSIFGLGNVDYDQIAREIHHSYNELSEYAHTGKKNQELSEFLYFYNNDLVNSDVDESIEIRKQLHQVCNEMIDYLTVLTENFVYLPEDKYKIIEEITQNG